MESFELEISVAELKIGMYVCRLDRPWLGSGFHFQGFQIDNLDQIDQVSSRCKNVYVDIDKSHRDVGAFLNTLHDRKVAEKIERFGPSRNSPPLKARLYKKWNPTASNRNGPIHELNPYTSTRYRDKTSVEEEMKVAKPALANFGTVMDTTFDQVSKNLSVDQDKIRNSVHSIARSIERNPDALIWLSRLGDHNEYHYRHCINTSIWSIALGRQIGLPPRDLNILGNGAIYCDLGKAKLPEGFLDSERKFDKRDMAKAQKHVDYSLEILDELGITHPTIRVMVAQHHERHNGTGYPVHLYKHQIDLYARIVSIADTFDALISDRPFQSGVAISEAISELYNQRDRLFQGPLVEEFIHAIGLYPAGSLVELNTGEVAVVVGESRLRRLRPKVMLLTDADKNHLKHFPLIDLMEDPDDGRTPTSILRDLKPGSYGLNPSDFFFDQ